MDPPSLRARSPRVDNAPAMRKLIVEPWEGT